MHLFVFTPCFHQHLLWWTEEKAADSRARGNKRWDYGMYVCVCVCVCVCVFVFVWHLYACWHTHTHTQIWGPEGM